ncbi:hypothetical protein [Cohnella silvisoli]|uniref:Uncharacterized protein n=1 Tax=Cohnella silvisoli TaxID=2873699 RepID=A0ABV1L0Y5_9BACL|nr:hypothetical protein [Cohnella silvisoli]MCD9024911.1 hypothetical protein [Cohnella silvisoli]
MKQKRKWRRSRSWRTRIPHLDVQWLQDERELHLKVMGPIQVEVLARPGSPDNPYPTSGLSIANAIRFS